ncbi:Rec8 like protein-domain-containing protein [Xylaria sp. CBS 124048]|nr:Rec8 like protein-domain-containing protein [Xylaria sp. CBS 124048]
MFYSHEILTSRQYGVSTIWLVATIGDKASTRKVARKAIQEVDVKKACGKILEPGAPIALRLQGNLLYGVSRVHNQQCTYLVTDAKKIQDQMKLFVKSFPGNQLDSEAGKARPENLLIEDDPAFDPDMPLPRFELDTLLFIQNHSQNTMKTSSQMSPFQSSQSPGRSVNIELDIDQSSSSGHHGSPFGLQGLSSAMKPDDERLIFPQEEDAFGVQGDWGLEIDENGNIVESAGPMTIDEEPQLPPLPPIREEDKTPGEALQLDERPEFDNGGDRIMQEEPLPEAEPLPERQQDVVLQNSNGYSRRAVARKKRKLQVDEETQLSRNTLRDWQTQYLELCGTYRARPVSSVQAKKNAMLLTFGLGIGNIGQSIGVPGLVHPLAIEYSGNTLFTALTGSGAPEPRGRRRTASEAVGDDEKNKGRRVRAKHTSNEGKQEEEQARVAQDQEDEFLNFDDTFDDGALPERGREAEQPMSDHLSSALLPWNRGSSAVPGSAIRAPNPVQQGRDLSSPSNRRRELQDIVRYSDDPTAGGFGGDDNFSDGLGSADHSFNDMAGQGSDGHGPEIGPIDEEAQSQNQYLFSQVGGEELNFLNFVQEIIVENGERRLDEDFATNRKWIAFDDLFVPRTTPRSTAAQAFYQTLSLLTKRKMYVQQDGEIDVPFGAIWIGLETIATNY